MEHVKLWIFIDILWKIKWQISKTFFPISIMLASITECNVYNNKREGLITILYNVLIYSNLLLRVFSFLSTFILSLTGWQSCAASDSCARGCIQSYMSRYGGLCAGQLGKSTSQLTCQDYGRLHNGGPNGCSSSSTIGYAARIASECGLN